MAVDPKDQAELNKLYNEYINLLQKVDKLSFAQAKNMADAAKNSGTLSNGVDRLNKSLQDTIFYTDSISQGFKETLADLKNQNLQLSIGKSAFKDLSNVASDLNYFQRGISDQTEKQFKLQQEKISKNNLELSDVRDRLGLINQETGEYRYVKQGLLDRLKSQDNLTASQKKFLQELEKEKGLLEAANNAIDEGIPTLQRELNISKQIFDVRKDLGGMATAAAGVVSKYGGSLSQFLNVNEAIDSVKKYNQNLIDGALKSKETIEAIRKIEEERGNVIQRSISLQQELSNITRDLADAEGAVESIRLNNIRLQEIEAKLATQGLLSAQESSDLVLEQRSLRRENQRLIDLSNRSLEISEEKEKKLKEIRDEEIQQRKDLAKLDEDEAKAKQKAIEGVNTFTNKFKSLGVLAKELGSGFKKALTDPLTILTFIIDRALSANAQVVELGKSFGISAKAAENIRQEVTSFARATGDTFVTTERLLKAQSELSKELGIAVQFSNEELETFSKLTELTGLSSQSAAKLARAAAVTGTPTKAYTNELRKAAFYAQQSTNTHFSSKEILEDIGKLSSGILIKFQGNPKALATAVVEAKKLGLTLDQIDKIGESLLNWESSIENELKAELLTGRELNMERARAAALSGDQLTLTREISNQVGSLEDYQNMNVLAQRSLAEAFGLSRDEMSEMLMQQAAINKYGSKAAELNKEQLEDMERQGLTLDEYLEKQEQQRTAQQKFQDAIVKLQDIIGSLFDGPVGQLVDAFADILTTAVNILSIFSPIFDIISGIAEFISDIASSTTGKWVVGLTAAAFLLPKLAGGFVGIFNSIGSVGKGITEAFSPSGFSKFFEGLFSGFKETESLTGKLAETAQETIVEEGAGGLTETVTDKAKEAVSGKAEEMIGGAEEVAGGADKVKGGGDGEDLKKKLQNIAEGLKSFANKDVFLGALNLIPTAIGLTAMIPGAVGAKLISLVDGEKLKKALVGMAEGIKVFGDNNLFKGAGNLIVASVGLTLMIPGAIGAKLISLVDGEKFQKSMEGIANGITSFGNNNLFKGALNLVVASIGLTLMIPGAIGAKLISLVDGEKFEESMYGMAYGIEAFGTTAVLKGAGVMVVAAVGLTAMIPGAIGAKLISLVDGEKFETTVKAIARGIEAFGIGKVAIGSLSMILAGIGLTAMIPGAIGAKLVSLVDGEKFEESAYGIAYGIEAFASGKVVAGSAAMILAAVGLTAMIPGAIGAKLISLVDGEKFETTVGAIARGIGSFGSGKVLLGSVAMVVAAVGLTAMIPGAIGAKLISLVDGEKFEESAYGITYGIEAFASGKVVAGSAAMILAGIGLTAMLPGALAAKLISFVDGEKFEKSMVGIAKGIEGFFKAVSYSTILKAAIAIALLGASLIPAAYAFNMFGDVTWDAVAKGFVALGGLAVVGYAIGKASDSMLKGAFAIAVLGTSLIPAAYALQMFAEVEWESLAKAGVTLIGLGAAGAILGSMAGQMIMGAVAIAALGASLIPAAYALQMFAEVEWGSLAKAGVALVGLGIAGAAFGAFLPLMLMGAVGIAALGTALIPFGIALNIIAPAVEKFTPIIEAFGNIVSKVFTGIATVITATSDGIVAIFSSLENVDVAKLLAIGPALIGIGIGLASLGAGNVIEAIGSFLGGGPAEKLEELAAAGDGLEKTSTALQAIGTSVSQLNSSLSALDIGKLLFIGPALASVKAGLDSLGGGGVSDIIASFVDGPVEKLERLANVGDKLQATSGALQSMAVALNEVSTALAGIDLTKLGPLDEFISNKSESTADGIVDVITSPFKAIGRMIGIGEENKEITPAPPNMGPTPTLNTPIGKEASAESINAGSTKMETITAGGIDLTPMVNAINEVRTAVNNLQNRPVKLYIDSREITARQLQANNSI